METPERVRLLEEAIKLITAVRDHDWKELIECFPEGVEHKGYKYTCSLDFIEWDTYEDFARYTSQARWTMKDKVLQKALDLLAEV
jgi:hypothetical protein